MISILCSLCPGEDKLILKINSLEDLGTHASQTHSAVALTQALNLGNGKADSISNNENEEE